ncbi:MAG: MBL fold metallo-hydrolase [Culicoidibacterales bacterium]
MRYTVLFSGSSGNCSYIEVDQLAILIDAGISCKKITNALEVHDIKLEQIRGILLTHEHTDHVIGLKQLVDRHKIPLFVTEKTYHAIAEKYRPILSERITFLGGIIKFSHPQLEIISLPISHDVVDGQFFVIEKGEQKLVYLTDSGYIAKKHYPILDNANGYIIESNHEPELVLQSRYPWSIQQRILSDKGHLSNQDCATVLTKIVGDKTTHITLAHLSEETNRPDLAYNRITESLAQINRKDIKVSVAKRDNYDSPSIKIER